jgi:diaminopropionate ammonia-lyase
MYPPTRCRPTASRSCPRTSPRWGPMGPTWRWPTWPTASTTTPRRCTPHGLAAELGVGAVYVKDEGYRLGLGSFKALGGSYVVVRLVLEEAARRLGHPVDVGELQTEAVRAVAATMTFACATDGNHGRSVAQGAQLVGAEAAIFMHGGVSDQRVAAIERFGARIIRVDGPTTTRSSRRPGWPTPRAGPYCPIPRGPATRTIPAMVAQGYTVLVRESLDEMDGAADPRVCPGRGRRVCCRRRRAPRCGARGGPSPRDRGRARAGGLPVRLQRGRQHRHRARQAEPTVMAMLECYEPSPLAWRVLERVADGFLTLE